MFASDSSSLGDSSLLGPNSSWSFNRKVCVSTLLFLLVIFTAALVVVIVIAANLIPGASFTKSSTETPVTTGNQNPVGGGGTSAPNSPIGSSCSAAAATLVVGTVDTFETPVVSDYIYWPPQGLLAVSATQPFSWNLGSGLGGIAKWNGSYAAVNANSTPAPSGTQMAVLQDPHGGPCSMSAPITGTTVGSSYTISMAFNTRAYPAVTNTTITVYMAENPNTILWSTPSPASSTLGQWATITSASFTATSCTNTLTITATPSYTADQSILIDNVVVNSVQ